jgi:sugar phosphate isomerase/epimerase
VDLRQFLRRARDLGFDGVMIAGKRPHLSPLDARDGWLEELAGELQETGLHFPVIAAYTDFGGTVAAEVPYLELQLAYVESLCRIGQRLGASIVRVFSAYEVPGQSPQATWRQAVGCLREACDRAAAYGLTVAIQNHHDIGLHTPALLEFLADVDRANCKLGFDAWSPGLRGEDLYEAARMAAPHTVMTTNADYIRLQRFRYRPELVNYEPVTPDLVRAVPFGTGCLDYSSFFRGLRDGGFDGVATYEMCSPIRGGGSLENLDRYARTYLNWMRRPVASESNAAPRTTDPVSVGG